MQLPAMWRVIQINFFTTFIFVLRACACLFVIVIGGCGIGGIIPDSDLSNVESGSRSTYIGAAVSFSNLEPDTSSSSQFTVSDTKDSGFALTLGRDLSRRVSLEARLGQLGTAELTPNASVDYSFAGVSGVYYPLGDEYLINRREGFLPFVRGGINYLIHDSSVELDQEDNFQVEAGVGVDFTFTNRLGVRAEINFHDVDAQAAHFGVIYRFSDIRDNYTPPESDSQIRVNPEVRVPPSTGQRTPNARVTRPPVRLPKAGQQPQPIPQTLPDVITVPKVVQEVETEVGIEVEQPITRSPVPLLKSGVLQGVRFASSSALLDIQSRNVLDQLATEIQQNPSLRLELQSHTDGARGADYALDLSRARVSQVGRYLISRGVSVQQLSARAYGNRRPLLTDIANVGNNRLELEILQR